MTTTKEFQREAAARLALHRMNHPGERGLPNNASYIAHDGKRAMERRRRQLERAAKKIAAKSGT